VMVKITGGGRGMLAIAAHFCYVTKHGKFGFENDRGETMQGRQALRDLEDEWRYAGSLIPDESRHREAYNIILSMPKGTDAEIVRKAAREFARAELADHRYVMVLHEHQANPHVHISVRAESRSGVRLNPRKPDLHRWRETFAEKLRGWGVEAEATLQPTRGQVRRYEAIWQVKAKEDDRLRKSPPQEKSGKAAEASRRDALASWSHVARALAASGDQRDRDLALSITRFVSESPAWSRTPQRSVERSAKAPREQTGDRGLDGAGR
jgi:hypothetical protein